MLKRLWPIDIRSNKSPVSLLVGTIIGVGIFALPFVALTAGFWLTVFYLITLALLSIITLLAYSYIIVETPGNHRLIGYTKIHLGTTTSRILACTHITSLLATQLAYLTIGGVFLANVLSFPSHYGVIAFFIAGALLIYFDSAGVNIGELLMTELMYLIVVVLFVYSVPHFHIGNLLGSADSAKNFFVPYGVVLFALWGAAVMPELVVAIGKDRARLRHAILTSLCVVVLIYLAFIISVLGSSGAGTSIEAIAGLQSIFPRYMIFIASLFGFLATITSFLGLGLLLKKTFTYDLGIKRLAWSFPTVIPLIGFALGLTSYLAIISVVGAVFIGFEAIIIYLMYIKIRKTHFTNRPARLVGVLIVITLLLIGIGLGIKKDIANLTSTSMARTPAPLPHFVQPTQELTLITLDHWKLKGNYYAATAPKAGAVLVHMYGRTQSDWDALIPKLLKANISVLTYDARGHGASQGNYADFTAKDFQNMSQDVYAADEYLKTQTPSKHIYLVGASIGANNVIRYASLNTHIQKVVALSPGLDYRGLYSLEYIASLRASVLLVASKGDSYSYASSEKIYNALPTQSSSKFIKLDGTLHGTNYLDDISDRLVSFLAN